MLLVTVGTLSPDVPWFPLTSPIRAGVCVVGGGGGGGKWVYLCVCSGWVTGVQVAHPNAHVRPSTHNLKFEAVENISAVLIDTVHRYIAVPTPVTADQLLDLLPLHAGRPPVLPAHLLF